MDKGGNLYSQRFTYVAEHLDLGEGSNIDRLYEVLTEFHDPLFNVFNHNLVILKDSRDLELLDTWRGNEY